MGQELRHQRVAVVGGMAGDQIVQRATEAIDVGPGIGVLRAQGLLGGHVIDRAEHGSGACQFGLRRRVVARADPSQSHVEDFDRALLV